MQKQTKRTISGFILIMFGVILCILPVLVSADEVYSLTINYEVSGAEFKIYRVGEFVGEKGFYLSGEFEKYGNSVSLNNKTSGEWNKTAETLYNYCMADGIKPVSAVKTGAEGRGTAYGLTMGLYVVSPSSVLSGGYRYTSEAFCVCLPNKNIVGEWTNNVEVSPKFTKEAVGEEDENDYRNLIVIWIGDNEDIRPENVEYTIYCDGEIYNKIILNKENNWQYRLNNLEKGHTWSVKQADLPEGYTTTIENEDKAFVVTNVYTDTQPIEPTESTTEEPAETTTRRTGGSSSSGGKKPTEAQTEDETEGATEETGEQATKYEEPTAAPEELPPAGDIPLESNDSGEISLPGAPEEPVNPDDENEYGRNRDRSYSDRDADREYEYGRNRERLRNGRQGENGEDLPQTGQLWYPVPILAGSGMTMFLWGYLIKKRNDENG